MLTTTETESQTEMTPTHVTMTTMDGMIPGKMPVALIPLWTPQLLQITMVIQVEILEASTRLPMLQQE